MNIPPNWTQRFCETCGKPLVRKIRPNGNLEHKGEYNRRRTCSKSCYSKWAAGKKHPHTEAEKEKFRNEATARMIGRRFKHLLVLKREDDYISPKMKAHARYLCKCDCGNIEIKRGYELRQGLRTSCNVCSSKRKIAAVTKHGFSRKEPLYTTWKGMRERCNNPNIRNHQIYYDRNIRVCKEWDDYSSFRAWALSHGWVHGLTIDRINGEKGYSPDNCRIVTMKENNDNRIIGRNKKNGQYISIRNNKGL